MTTFLDIFAQIAPLSDESRGALFSISKRMDLPKGHVLVRQDTICNYIYFIEKGLTRTYYFKNGKDITDWFSFENTVACSILNFITRQADRRIIELLEPSTLWGKPNAQNPIHPIIRYVKSTPPFTSSFFLKKNI